MKLMHVMGAMALALALPSLAQAPPSGTASNGLHPDDHGPDITVRSKKRPRVKKRKWRMTVGHVRSCKRRYKTYNPKSDRYVARPGLRRRCVL